jgi:membrane protease subunit (stomatin/prohibitin family)
MDTIEFVNPSNKVLVYKYVRPSGNNEIRQGAKVIVRESQEAVFISRGEVADTFGPGTFKLNTGNLPFLSTLGAIGHAFNSPIKADIYFVSMQQFIDSKWFTKNPVICRDPEFDMIRVRGFGAFAFRIVDSVLFMKEIFGTKGLVLTFDVIQYLSSLISEAFSVVISENKISILDYSAMYSSIGDAMKLNINKKTSKFGIEITDVVVENISLPEEVEKLIDEQSGIGMASRNMDSFIQYQSARAIRDAAKQKSGLAGIGAGMEVGRVVAKTMESGMGTAEKKKVSERKMNSAKGNYSVADELLKYKKLFDEGILNESEFDEIKTKILKGDM